MKKNKSGASKGDAPSAKKSERKVGGADARKFTSFEDVGGEGCNNLMGEGCERGKK